MNDSEWLGRQSKKRKYVLLGENWGQLDGVKKCGLNRKLDNNSSMGSRVTTSKAGTGPLGHHKEVGNTLSSNEKRLQELEGEVLIGNRVY